MRKNIFLLAIAVILGPSIKYGPNGYEITGASSTAYVKHKSTTINNTELVQVKSAAVLGFSAQTVPENSFGLSIGASYYNDSTVTLTLGVGL